MLEGTGTSNMVMPVAPTGGGFGGGGFGMDWGWIILLLLFAGGGWGGGFGGMDNVYPWLNNSQNINDGFRDSMLNDSLTGISNGVQSLGTQICSGFAGVEQGANTRQMADMQTAFGQQMAMSQGFNGVQSQLSQCCCDNRAAIADLKYTVATEACADRNAISNALKDVIAAQTASTQRILDQMCQDKIDAKNERITQLEAQLNFANLQASQTAQTATLEQYIASRIPATTA